MKEHKVEIGGREFPLAFTLNTMIKLQEDIPDFDFKDLDERMKNPKGFVDMLFRLAFSGAALENKKLDVDRDWLAERIPVNNEKISAIANEASLAIVESMLMETEQMEKEGREVDVSLEKIKKNEEITG